MIGCDDGFCTTVKIEHHMKPASFGWKQKNLKQDESTWKCMTTSAVLSSQCPAWMQSFHSLHYKSARRHWVQEGRNTQNHHHSLLLLPGDHSSSRRNYCQEYAKVWTGSWTHITSIVPALVPIARKSPLSRKREQEASFFCLQKERKLVLT